MGTDLVSSANRNLQTAFRKLANHVPGGETNQFGSIQVAFSGLPVPIYNRAFVFDTPHGDNLRNAISWMTDREEPFWMTVSERVLTDFESILSELPLEKTDRVDPGMALELGEEIPANSTDAEISSLADESELGEIARISASVFETPIDIARQAYQPSLLDDDTTQVFIGRVDGQPAASGLMVRSGDVVGVYTIGVLEEYRRRGIGEAMTWEVIRTGRDVGCRLAVLQSSEMAYSLYEKMGFETVVTYHHFAGVS